MNQCGRYQASSTFISMKFRSSLVLAIIILSISAMVKSQEVDDEHEFSYLLDAENGPHKWGKVNKEWAACGNGTMQSPVDISRTSVQIVHHLGRIRRTYKPANAVMRNRGHDIMVKWDEDAGGVFLNGMEYPIKQLHWHSPSEHSINGKRYELEVHMVHQSSDNKIAVIGIMYKVGRPDTLLRRLERYIKKLKDVKDGEEKLGMINPRNVKWGSRKYYRYLGSLSTPPCTESVLWHIINKVRTVSKEQLQMLREAVHDESEMNARPIQPLNDRVIEMYRPAKITS